MVKKIAIFSILLPATLLFSYIPAEASSSFVDIVAESALLAEADTGQILFEHNTRHRHPPGSLAKTMTLLIAVNAIESGEVKEGDLVTMTDTAWFDIAAKSSPLNIRPGEEMTLLDLMYSAYVGSANEACNMIAEHIAGSVESFVEMMNSRAVALGCDNTNFTNPHGQHHENQYTTARDQFLIFRDAVSKPLFAEISGVFRHTIQSTNMSDTRRLTGTNSLLNPNGKYYFRHCTAGKASVMFEGGHSFEGIAESDGLSIIAIVLGSDEILLEDDSYDMRNLTEARRLFEWGFSQFGWRIVISPSEPIAKTPILHGAGADFVNLRAESEIKLLLNNDIPLDAFIRTITIYSDDADEPLVAPIEAGDVLGEISVTRGGVEYGPVLLVANTSIQLHRFEFIRIQAKEMLSSPLVRKVIWGLVIIFVGYIALVVRYNIVRRKRMRRIALAKRRLAEERQQALEEERRERERYNGGHTRPPRRG